MKMVLAFALVFASAAAYADFNAPTVEQIAKDLGISVAAARQLQVNKGVVYPAPNPSCKPAMAPLPNCR